MSGTSVSYAASVLTHPVVWCVLGICAAAVAWKTLVACLRKWSFAQYDTERRETIAAFEVFALSSEGCPGLGDSNRYFREAARELRELDPSRENDRATIRRLSKEVQTGLDEWYEIAAYCPRN